MLKLSYKNLATLFHSSFAWFFITLLHAIRPLLGPATCRFPLSCMAYATQELRNKLLPVACWRIFRRLLVCSPFGYIWKSS